MADTGRQTIITPEDLGSKNVFVINDIDLVIPPSQITVRKEDLIYRWRTLRTKSATKIPTGHGRVDVHVTMYFTAAQMLALHRLIVQFRHSPFCYVDNRYLRETIVPDWPLHQNMAFTMTGIAVSPMPGSSDTWVCELDLVWFNYFPYMHNWLYRQDWQTNWIYKTGDRDESTFNSYTIGWTLDLDTYQRIHVPIPIESVMQSYGSATFETSKRSGQLDALAVGQVPDVLHDEWSVVQAAYRDKGKKTVFDMELAHTGVEWDMVPLPDNMMPSFIVAQPKRSRIYVRYINFLQRDALYKNFGINVEKDLLDLDAREDRGNKWHVDAFFGMTGETGQPEVFGLHTNRVARSLRKKWIGQMLQHNHGIKFSFHALKEIRFPQKWVDRSDGIKNEVIGNFAKRMGNILSRADRLRTLTSKGTADGADITIPVLLAPYRITSPFGPRNRPTAKASKTHRGIDIGCPIGTPVVAPEDGTIEYVRTLEEWNDNAGNHIKLRASDGGAWLFFHLSEMVVQPGQFVAKGSLIALSGNSAPPGVSTGPHLHLEYAPPRSGDRRIDPVEKLENILYEDNIASPVLEPELVHNLVEATPEAIEQHEAQTELQEQLDLTSEEADALAQLLTLLETEGWKYYDKDTSLLNVWEKLINLEIAHSGLDIFRGGDTPEQFVQEGVVLTNVAGSLSHIVANLPILSSEFPTQQHLGSIEPQYSFEFAVLDDQGNLEGISKMAQFLHGMRSLLQKNARQFRPVTDGWTVATDTFITRLFGSYTENDIREYRSGDTVLDLDVTKRTVISSSTSGTVEGNPGLSFINFTVEETNPYQQEVLTSTAPQLEDKEEARQKILQAIYNLDFIEKYQRILLPTLIAQTAGSNTNRPGENDYGKFFLDVYHPLSMDLAISRGRDSFVLEENGNQYLLLKKTTEELDYLINGLTDEDGNPIRVETVENTLGLADNILDTSDDPSGLINVGGPFQQQVLDSILPGDWSAEYYKIPFNQAGLGNEADSRESWITDFESRRSFTEFGERSYYDISETLSQYPEVGDIPIEKILDLWKTLHHIINTGNRMFAEPISGGKDNKEIRKELYDLPFKNRMWQSWQEYLKAFVQATPVFFAAIGTDWIPGFEPYNGRAAVDALQKIPGWPTPGANAFYREKGDARQNTNWPQAFDLSQTLDAQEVSDIQAIANEYFGILGAPTGALQSLDDKIFGYLKGTIGAALSSNIDVADFWRQAHYEAIERLVNRYMRHFPITVSLPDRIKDKYNYLFGDLLGNFTDETNKVPALATMHSALRTNADSCGNITALSSTGNPWFQISNVDPFVIHRGENGEELRVRQLRTRRGGFTGGARLLASPVTTVVEGTINTVANVAGAVGSKIITSLGDSTGLLPGRTTNDKTLDLNDELIRFALSPEEEALLYPLQQIGNPLNSEFKYPVNAGEEEIKVRYIKSILSTIADDILIDPDILKVFGLEELALQDRQTDIKGSECYPDMDLPSHPYYGDTYQVYPDFYMWNIYTDGSALNTEDQEKIYQQMEAVVENCYASMKGLEEGRTWDQRQEKILTEGSVDDPIQLSTMMSPEATDGGRDGSGPTAGAFDETRPETEAAIVKFNTELENELGDDAQNIMSTKVDELRLSAAEGAYGAGAGVHYPSRVAPALYGKLQEDVRQVERMFGSKAGYANEYIDQSNTPEISGRTEGSNLERPSFHSHSYNLGSLKKLARDSAKDLLSQKMTLRRAYPTFKLFFVEEDEFESRFLNFDDFYSYNAVKEFTVVQSRKLPADHAVITIQNVSGTLDGTKRNTIVDLDYLDKTAGKKLEAGLGNGSAIGGDSVTKDTAQDQPFGAVVLRPGLNVQLRCGYSNDPDNLHVMLSGRVVDVSWNKTGDLAEIMVQSFGTELIQSVKGTARDGRQKSYRTTHELLGSMMLEPEVVHFGRWEFGQLFQIGEASDHRLDFTDYSREGFMGRFKATSALTNAVVNHPWITLGIGVGLTAVNFLPLGRIFGTGGSIGARLLGKAGIASPLGKVGFTRTLTAAAAKNGIALVDDAGKAVRLSKESIRALASVADDGIRGTYNVALKKAGSETFEAVLSKRMGAVSRVLQASGTLDDIVAQSVKAERYFQMAAFKGQWMAKPWVSGAQIFSWGAIGKKPISTAFSIFLSAPTKVGLAAVGTGLIIDTIVEPILSSIYNNTVGAARKFFTRTQAHLFLTPQDDNLYPPHPKDYMTLSRGYIDDAIESALVSGSRVFFSGDDAGLFAYRLWQPNEFLSKKVDPGACTYEIVNSTIWEIFHEMSLRHPGWVYGPRPYGNKFRYTMFFGVPSQRYWARPAGNRFIARMNRLRRFLEGRKGKYGAADRFEINEAEFKSLYGELVYNDISDRIEAGITQRVNNEGRILRTELEAEAQYSTIQFEKEQILRRELTAIPLREYLRGLNLRFVPFRRYHMFTSERDIIWNGIMSSENAVTNAVDVTYWSSVDQDAGETSGNIQTAVFKAHSFIPEHQLRIAPVRWANCNTYQMAMRYGMGELLHRMRDMYRGEILLLGNPRIRPWDIGILADSYNDMVGPVEVEQVVHTFSHETGFITEIKPSAVVFGNEISGWPMVEAMKMFAMAIKDIEDRYGGIKAEDPDDPNSTGVGFLGTLASLVNAWGARGGDFDSFINEKYRRIFGDEFGLDQVFGENPPNTESLDNTVSDIETKAKIALAYAGATTVPVGLTVGLAGTIAAGGGLIQSLLATNPTQFATATQATAQYGKAFIKSPAAVVGGATALTGLALLAAGGTAMYAAEKLDFPSMIWLVGGPLLMLHCLRNEAIMLVPLIKNGNPIVSGLAYNDPSMIWNNFRGEINRYVEDTLEGTKDMASLYQRYGSAIWNRLNDPHLTDMTGEGIGNLNRGL